MRTIPRYFYLNGELHKYIKTIKSDNSVVAWSYRQEKRLWYPRYLVRQEFRRAFTITEAARLIRISSGKINQLIVKGLFPAPERTYDLATYRPMRAYINEDDMLTLRQAAWDVLPKNRFGEPHDDSMANEDELLHLIKLTDDREFIETDDGFQQVYQARS